MDTSKIKITPFGKKLKAMIEVADTLLHKNLSIDKITMGPGATRIMLDANKKNTALGGEHVATILGTSHVVGVMQRTYRLHECDVHVSWHVGLTVSAASPDSLRRMH